VRFISVGECLELLTRNSYYWLHAWILPPGSIRVAETEFMLVIARLNPTTRFNSWCMMSQAQCVGESLRLLTQNSYYWSHYSIWPPGSIPGVWWVRRNQTNKRAIFWKSFHLKFRQVSIFFLWLASKECQYIFWNSALQSIIH